MCLDFTVPSNERHASKSTETPNLYIKIEIESDIEVQIIPSIQIGKRNVVLCIKSSN